MPTFLDHVDFSKVEARNLVTHKLAAAPASPVAGQRYYDTTLNKEGVYNGASWDRLRATIANGLAVDVTRLSPLVTGAAVVGKVGIDQTTPGTTNLVSIGAAIKAASTAASLADASAVVQDANLGNQADASATTDAGTFSLIALFKRLLVKITTQLPAALGFATSAASLPVVLSSDTATGTITTQNLVPGGAATAGSAVEITLNGASTIGPQVVGTYTGALSLQVSVDGTNWITVGGTPLLNVNTGGFLASITSALQGIFQADVGAFTKARITALGAVTGTVTVTIRVASPASLVALDAPVTIGSGTVTTVSSVTSVAASTPAVTTTTAATLSSAATTNATSVKASAGNLYSVTASNVGAAAAFLKIFNLATAPTVGTSVPFLTIPIAASGVVSIPFGAQGMRMATGIAFAITNLVADSDTTAIAAAQVKVVIAYI